MSGQTEKLATITTREIQLWLVVVLITAIASAFRCLRNGQWKDWKHTAGVVGCGAIGSWCLTAFAYFASDTVKANVPLLISIAAGASLLGKDFHERLISSVLNRATGIETKDKSDGVA